MRPRPRQLRLFCCLLTNLDRYSGSRHLALLNEPSALSKFPSASAANISHGGLHALVRLGTGPRGKPARYAKPVCCAHFKQRQDFMGNGHHGRQSKDDSSSLLSTSSCPVRCARLARCVVEHTCWLLAAGWLCHWSTRQCLHSKQCNTRRRSILVSQCSSPQMVIQVSPSPSFMFQSVDRMRLPG